MDLQLGGRRALVGGASGGIGLATARALAAEGVELVIGSRDAARIEAAAKEIGGRTRTLVCDLSDPDGAREFAERGHELLGGVDILIANGGGPPPGPALGADLDGLRAALDRCMLAMVAMCQTVLPGMRERGWGRIVAVTSIGVRQPLENMVYSNASRTGLTAYLKTLAREVIRDGVTVNTMLPMNIVTDRLHSLIGDGMEAYLSSVPAGRGGEPDDFGRVAAFLCSESARYLSGVALPVDGAAGVTLT